jgi:hypothetical protein
MSPNGSLYHTYVYISELEQDKHTPPYIHTPRKTIAATRPPDKENH